MTINKCRVCNNKFFKEPLLKYKNMPSVAQNFPDAESLENDKSVDLEICQCSGCGLVQLSNEPVDYYKEVIRAAGFSKEMQEFRKRQFEEFIEKYSLQNKKIIEVGCGNGEYLSIINQLGVEAYGLEQSEKSVKQCVKKGLKVSKGFVESEDYKIKEAPFDCFFILSFLEHLPKPNETLRGIYNNLADDTIGIVEVPNFDKMLQENLFSEFTRDHLLYFTKETLKTTLRINGFEVIECNVVWHEYILSVVVKKMKKLDTANFYKTQEKLKTEIREYIDRFENKKVAVWGAGHQALAVISMMDIASDIKYVVDSALFKQGKYTPATHIPIISPEKLDSEPVEAIIVMAASYSDEVSKIIKEKYGNKIDIAILRENRLEVV